MATRIRKQNTSSPLPPKDEQSNTDPLITDNESTENGQAPVKVTSGSKPSLAKKLANKNLPKKLTKKASILKLKPTIKKNVKKKIIDRPKKAETKKKLLNPCAKQIKPKKPKVMKNPKENLLPPVLEPMLPIDDELVNKQVKKNVKPPRIDNFSKKTSSSDTETLSVDPTKTKRVYKRKPKVQSESIEDVMSDLSSLIKAGDIKKEPEAESAAGKSDSPKPKKVVRRKKKENIENRLRKLSPQQRKVIDMLDLNVTKFKDLPIPKRRHSVEKFPVSLSETDLPNLNRLSILNNLPRSLSPRTKSFPKVRQTVDGFGRRSNPYKTRSDSSARILRNGKQRRLKDIGLLEGLDIAKRRRRNCSEFSGSEMSFRQSGYESDSSFSDLSSVHGAENTENKEIEGIKRETVDVKPETNDFTTDTNSNLCNKENTSDNTENKIKKEGDSPEVPAIGTSSKVPDKSIILDIMKQTFNDTFEEKERSTKQAETLTSTPYFYENAEKLAENIDIEELDKVNFVRDESNKPEETIDLEEADAEVLQVNGAALQNGDLHKEEAEIEETPEDLAIKENILQALGLQSLKAAKEAKLKVEKEKAEQKSDCYTGTLKTVIKINRGEKKKGRAGMKLAVQKNKHKIMEGENNGLEDLSKAPKEAPSTSWKTSGQSSDTAGAHRKTHYSNRSNLDGSSEHTSDGETGAQEGATKTLVIPEKASSFSIHPGRICKDECSYCFGKFGLFDTPCHIAQMKSVERQNKILAAERHLTQDSCLCDACYRHVDRKANTPSYINKSYKRSAVVAPGPRQDHCHVLGCGGVATNILRRKWIIKMRKSICEVINIDLDNPGLHSIPICDEHYLALEHLMVCAMCKRRLAKNHVHYLGPETADLNSALAAEEIPLALTDKPVVCKLCKYFAAIILRPLSERPENSSTFFRDYKKRLLHFNDIIPMDEAAAEEPIIIPTKDSRMEREQQLRKRRKMTKMQSAPGDTSDSLEQEKSDQSRVPSNESASHSRPESPSDYMVDYNTLIPSIAMDCGSDSESKKESAKPTAKKLPRPESVKQAVEISKNMKLKNDKSSDIAVQRLGSNPSISVRQLFPCEEDLPLQGHVDFGNVKERTPEGWEKCTSVVQYDNETKLLWQELQKPYGNQSSFLRHLILLEKYFRNGDLVLAPNANHHSVSYSESVHNRLRAYDNIPTSAGNVQPLSMLPFNKPQKSTSGIITSTAAPVKEHQAAPPPPKNTPITISQLNSPPLIPTPVVTVTSKPKPVGAPPGLISLLPGTNKPAAPLVKPQSQKIKFPITKNWRPNLIPIDPSKKLTERRAGLVQVISGGKPYHITLEDYKKMCAIKKSFELKQKRLQEASASATKPKLTYNSVLKAMAPKKGLVISKTKSEAEEENRLSENKPPLALPKIPKSLTVIPQTVTRKPSRPSSPILLITPKPKQIMNKS